MSKERCTVTSASVALRAEVCCKMASASVYTVLIEVEVLTDKVGCSEADTDLENNVIVDYTGDLSFMTEVTMHFQRFLNNFFPSAFINNLRPFTVNDIMTYCTWNLDLFLHVLTISDLKKNPLLYGVLLASDFNGNHGSHRLGYCVIN